MDPDQIEITSRLKQSRSRRRGAKAWLLLLIIGLGAGGGWLLSLQDEASKSIQFRTETLSHGDLTVTISATGSVEPTNTVDVSSELSGTISAVAVDFNDPVKAGDVLARLDTSKLEAMKKVQEANLRAAEARLVKAQVNLEEAREEAQRARTLKDRNVSSALQVITADAAFERMKADVVIARADIARERANLAVTEEDLADACLRSPVDGVVLERKVNQGQTVAASMSAPVLFTIAESLSEMELQLSIDEADIGRLKEAQRATFTVDAYPAREFPAQVKTVRFAPEVIDNVVTYLASLEVDNPDLVLRPGMTASADILVNEVADALLVPNAALRFVPDPTGSADDGPTGSTGMLGLLFSDQPSMVPPRPTTNTLWVLRDNGMAEIEIVRGDTNGRYTEILGGDVQPGDRVIVGVEN
ncbi:efflux RND transporter periplasmic adaptor subunit [Roseibium denhamense]|uniref:HlyD family secretion protein n=1 Tax=Roseibium denhamense TaxID=76305 RepID=A0ABY1P9T1_9HYPH|nr:efflux RND transporter periplasmic adaptor subunit [Roseibium denhamense]MTI07448.1 efflux RND transporter periplasmic adaptor subunit [Roseibium denhamense]SMP29773.1 HlyD family secretion protein [Roseibium denhamense]